MNIAVIGLGRMGEAIAARAVNAGYAVFGFDPSAESCAAAERSGVTIVSTLENLENHAIKLFWLMVPQGPLVDTVIEKIKPIAQKGAIIIDGGNSKYTDSMRRAENLKADDLYFLDCGTSGGVHGRVNGFCLMVGGAKDAYDTVAPLLKSVACEGGCEYVGPSGAGHYVKMVHNGIEYGILQAYAEGFHLLKDGEFKDAHLNLEQISRLWNNGSVIRSWILDLVHDVMKDDQNLDDIAGNIAATGMGKWTVEAAHVSKIPVPVIEESLKVRDWSEKTGGNYATKVVAMLRNKFGGHAVTKK
jgi:6-phosphogluconate dehydrogenase